jgi:hypothetical protein
MSLLIRAFTPTQGPASAGLSFLQWMSCEHPHDRTGRILRFRSISGAPALSSLSAEQITRWQSPHPLRDQEGRQAGHDLAALSSAQAAQTFSRVTVIYLTLADAGLWKSRVVRGCAERPRVPAGVLWGHPWGAGRLPPNSPDSLFRIVRYLCRAPDRTHQRAITAAALMSAFLVRFA